METKGVERQDWIRYVMVFNKWDDEQWHFIDAPCIKGRFNFLHQKEVKIMLDNGIIEFCLEKIQEANPAPNKDIAEISFYCDFLTAKDTFIHFKDSRRDNPSKPSNIKGSGNVIYFNAN